MCGATVTKLVIRTVSDLPKTFSQLYCTNVHFQSMSVAVRNFYNLFIFPKSGDLVQWDGSIYIFIPWLRILSTEIEMVIYDGQI